MLEQPLPNGVGLRGVYSTCIHAVPSMIATAAFCKRLRPHGVWGWYNYPVDAWSATLTELTWLFDEVTALFPSIYLVSRNASANVRDVDRVLNQTRQLREATRLRRLRM